MAKKKENQNDAEKLNSESIVLNSDLQKSETANEILQPVIEEENQNDAEKLNSESIAKPIKAEIIEPKEIPVQKIEDGRVQVQGAHFKVNVSSKTSEIISKFKK